MDAKSKPEAKTEPAAPAEVVTSYKGFDVNLQCRGFQFEIGKSYEIEGEIEVCARGFHACENPLDVFGYYAPGTSRFAVVQQAGALKRHDQDSKIASAKITIEAELHISDMIQRAVAWVISKATPEKGSQATGEAGAASATGEAGAASATGYAGAASATGTRGAASATGTRGAASATGEAGAASATGEAGAASATGEAGAASATGEAGRAQGADGCALFLVYRDPKTYKILHAWAGIVGRDGIKPLTWYTLDASGKPVEA